MMVVYFHIRQGHLAPMAGLAVDLFFLISGVVMEKSYRPRLYVSMGPHRFLFLRAVRLYPLYALSIVTMLLVIAIAPGQGFFQNSSSVQMPASNLSLMAVAAFLGVPLLHTVFMYPLNQPAWTLFFEVLANILYVFLFPVLNKKLLLAIIAVSFTGLVIDVLHPCAHGHMLNGLSRVGFSFFLGVLMWRLNLPRFIRQIPSWAVLALCLALLFSPTGGQFYPIVYLALLGLGFPAVVYLALQTQPPPLWRPLYQLMGDTCYPVYLMHTALFILIFSVLAPRYGWELGAAARIIFTIVLVALCSALNRYFDTPLRRLLIGAATRRPAATPIAAP
jgi:peptidoglycan/LPS O-acetylase OafA/YrhL